MNASSTFALQSSFSSLHVCPDTGKVVDIQCEKADGSIHSLLVSKPSDFSIRSPGLSDVFDIRHAWGMDECFPSVGAHPECYLRDHGWIWNSLGTHQHLENSLVSEWALWDNQFFQRSISTPNQVALGCASSTSAPGFLVSTRFPRVLSMPQNDLRISSLYAAHALFAAEESDILEIWAGEREQEGAICWRGVFPESRKTVARKFFVEGRGKLWARLIRSRLGIEIKIICGDGLPHLGIWWCNNGWGDGRSHRTIGIEPTNHLSDGPIFRSLDTEALPSPICECSFRYVINLLSEEPL